MVRGNVKNSVATRWQSGDLFGGARPAGATLVFQAIHPCRLRLAAAARVTVAAIPARRGSLHSIRPLHRERPGAALLQRVDKGAWDGGIVRREQDCQALGRNGHRGRREGRPAKHEAAKMAAPSIEPKREIAAFDRLRALAPNSRAPCITPARSNVGAKFRVGNRPEATRRALPLRVLSVVLPTAPSKDHDFRQNHAIPHVSLDRLVGLRFLSLLESWPRRALRLVMPLEDSWFDRHCSDRHWFTRQRFDNSTPRDCMVLWG
jgi:hypothetical protein